MLIARPPRGRRADALARRAAVFAAAALFAGCGARTELAGADAGGGASTDGASSASTGGAGPTCAALDVAEPVIVVAGAGLRAPDAALLPDGDVLLAGLAEAGGLASLSAGRLGPFGAWPPAPLGGVVGLAPIASQFVLGDGPVAYYNDDSGALNLLTKVYPVAEAIALGTGGVRPLFVAAAPTGRYLTGAATPTPAYEVLDVGSYEPGSLPQKEEPLVCLTSPHLGSAIGSGSGFLAAFLSPNPPEPACDVAAPKPGTVLVVGRYAGGPDLTFEVGHLSVSNEPFFHALLAPREGGAWLLEQTDGSTSFTPPELVVRRLDEDGIESPIGAPGLAIPGSGQLGEVAIARLGASLAVAWVDAIDPSAPTVIVQLVGPDLTLGPTASLSTGPAWLFGSLHMVASADATKLLLTWDASGGGAATVGAARVDCVTSP